VVTRLFAHPSNNYFPDNTVPLTCWLLPACI